jgi:hypothetical protein
MTEAPIVARVKNSIGAIDTKKRRVNNPLFQLSSFS